MEYQISYLSPLGYIKQLVDAFVQEFPHPPRVCHLTEDTDTTVDGHLVGFEVNSEDSQAVPPEVMNFLGKLSGKRIVVFMTTPFRANDILQREFFTGLCPSYRMSASIAECIFALLSHLRSF